MLPHHFCGGLELEAGIVFPEPAITAFLDEASKAGAELHFETPVIQWTEQSSSVIVRTAHNTFEADRLLLAAGAWSKGLWGTQSVVLQPKRVAVHWIEPADSRAYLLNNFPVNFWQVPVHNDPLFPEGFREFYSLPALKPGGQIKIAFHNGLPDGAPDSNSREVYAHETAGIKDIISTHLPELAGCPIQADLCFYTMTPDNDFYLGKLPGSKRVVGAALAGHGFKFAPVLGEMLADMLLNQSSSIDTSMFSPDRFETP